MYLFRPPAEAPAPARSLKPKPKTLNFDSLQCTINFAFQVFERARGPFHPAQFCFCMILFPPVRYLDRGGGRVPICFACMSVCTVLCYVCRMNACVYEYVCMCACIRACMHVCMHARMHGWIYECLYAHTYTQR